MFGVQHNCIRFHPLQHFLHNWWTSTWQVKRCFLLLCTFSFFYKIHFEIYYLWLFTYSTHFEENCKRWSFLLTLSTTYTKRRCIRSWTSRKFFFSMRQWHQRSNESQTKVREEKLSHRVSSLVRIALMLNCLEWLFHYS